MKDTIRTFIAIKIIPQNELRSFLGTAKNTFFDESIKWVDDDNLHLTLRFLGETNNKQVHEISRSIRNLSIKTKKFSIELKGTGYFKNNRIPKVFFVKIEESENLKNLAKVIDSEVSEAGFESNLKSFKPHLTLGRIKHLKNIERFVLFNNDWKEYEFQTVQVSEIIFFQSILNNNGPIYKPLDKFLLE